MKPARSEALAGLAQQAREEWFFGVAAAAALVLLFFGNAIFAGFANPLLLALIFVVQFAVVLGAALAVVRHADRLAERLGEPYGTLVLTLTITTIEVIGISAVMLHGANNPTLVRDTLFAVVMIVLNGMVGLSLLFGAWRNREQHFNLQGANTYLGVIVPLAALSLIMPTFTVSGGASYSATQQVVLGLMSAGLYAVFLALQMGRHRGYFTEDGPAEEAPAAADPGPPARPIWIEVALLLAYMVPVIFLVDQLAQPIDYVVETLRAPAALGGVVMAVLVATPETIGAVRAALADHLQRSVNIFLGSVLSTIGLTVPAMLAISAITGHPVILGLEHANLVMLVLTLAVSIITFASGRTNLLQGAVHLLLFVSYVLLIFEN